VSGLDHYRAGREKVGDNTFNTPASEVVLGKVVVVGVVEQCLGGNAANVQASSSEGPTLLNARGLEAKLGGLDGSDVASRASTNNHQVLLLCQTEEEE
jgi:hypothetical protein